MTGPARLLRLAGTSLLVGIAWTPLAQAQLEELELDGPGKEDSFAQEPEQNPGAAAQEPGDQEPSPAPALRGGPFAHLDPAERITINFKEQELTSILELFATQYNLNLVYTSDIVGDVTLNLYEVAVPTALLQILASNGYTFVIQDDFIRVVYAEDVVVETVASGSPFEPTVIYLDHVTAADATPILTPLLAGNEKLIPGPASDKGIVVSDDLGGNSQGTQELIVFYASEETMERVHALLDEIDLPPMQVLVEATILAVSLSEENKLGVDLNMLSGIDFQALNGTSNITDGVTVDPVGVGRNSWLLGGRTSGFTDANSDGLHFGVLRNQLGVFVEALESVGNTTVLSNPQVLTVNRHLAEVLVGQRLPYITTSVSQTSSTQSVEFLEVGTSLVFRPFISGDGYVRMEILPKSSSGVINSQGLPEETTTQVTANVLVKSGHTVVIGGLMETRESTDTEQVPLLGTLPFIGPLFRSESQAEIKSEIIVLLTPHIVGEGDLERRADLARARFDAARARLAASHHGYLRPSYARRMYREAALLLARGDAEAALAKAEWGLMAMPADPDLALLAEHCHNEVRAGREEERELRDALRILEMESSE